MTAREYRADRAGMSPALRCGHADGAANARYSGAISYERGRF
jgi:hypothetical protein